jgi:hypothetical protein
LVSLREGYDAAVSRAKRDDCLDLRTMTADWLNHETKHLIAELFREHGVVGAVSLMPAAGDDEAIFVVSSTDAARPR